MNKTQQLRIQRLMPKGIPKWIRCYDNGGTDVEHGTIDRYTVVYTGNYRKRLSDGHFNCDYQYVGMSSNPFSPQGFGQHGESKTTIDTYLSKGWPVAIGRKNHLGTRINFSDLPKDCQNLVISDYKDIWGIK